VDRLAELLCRYSGLTVREYAEMLGRPIPSVRRDLVELRRRGVVVSHRDPVLSRDFEASPNTLYWNDTKCDVFVDVAYSRVPNVPHPSDERGWVTHRVVAVLERSTYDVKMALGSELGHISVSHVPRAAFDERYPDVGAYARSIKGVRDPGPDVLDGLRDAYRRFRTFHVESMHVAFVEVHEAWRRRDIALSLYHEAAEWVGEREGLALAASDLQASEVRAFWGRLLDDEHGLVLPDGRPALSYVRGESRS